MAMAFTVEQPEMGTVAGAASGTPCTRRRGRPVRFEDVADLLPGLVDGTIRVDERTQEFIESDLRCQAELARYRKLLRTLE